MAYLSIIVIGLQLGLGKAFLIEFLPHLIESKFSAYGEYGGYISLSLLAFAAILAYLISQFVAKKGAKEIIPPSLIILTIGVLIIALSPNFWLMIMGGIVTAASFSFLNVSGLPYTIQTLSAKHITYGVGVYIGASELFTGIMEYTLR